MSREQAQIVFPNLTVDAAAVVEGECYQTLLKIKAILEDEHLDDRDCFLKIEEIISTMEVLSSSAGYRHDL